MVLVAAALSAPVLCRSGSMRTSAVSAPTVLSGSCGLAGHRRSSRAGGGGNEPALAHASPGADAQRVLPEPMFNNQRHPFAVGGVWASILRTWCTHPAGLPRLSVAGGLPRQDGVGDRAGAGRGVRQDLLLLYRRLCILALSAGWQAAIRQGRSPRLSVAVARRGWTRPPARDCCRSPRSPSGSCWCSGRGAQAALTGHNPRCARPRAFFSHGDVSVQYAVRRTLLSQPANGRGNTATS